MTNNLLFEIGCEELPPKSLSNLSDSFRRLFTEKLRSEKINFDEIKSFCTPRRLAVIIKGLAETSTVSAQEFFGPPKSIAFDNEGNPTQAAKAFLVKNNLTTLVSESELATCIKDDRLYVSILAKPKNTINLLENLISDSLKELPIPKRMRWGSSRYEFVRPVKWITLVYGNDVIDAEILGIKSGNQSFGHRFMAPNSFSVSAETYEEELQKHFVIADIDVRKKLIKTGVVEQATSINGKAQISDDLLNEVAALVEWPVAITGKFDNHFLSVPPEALISSMAGHQKYFHVLDFNNKLLPNFITVANLDSLDMPQIIQGNERVIRPRLSDAAFFFETDKKKTLESRCEQLKTIVFQHELGTVYEKTLRVSKLAAYIAAMIGSNTDNATRAGLLCKSDLVTEMVLEFTDLQGLMGKYYAEHDGENAEVASAIYEHYLPTGASSELPQTQTGYVLALADRIDTLIGIFGIGQQPTGNKDPFALRRATLGIINIIVQKSLSLDLEDLYTFAYKQFNQLTLKDTVERALNYTIERFRAYYHDKHIATEVFLSVAALNIFNPFDFDQRVRAVHQFYQLEEATSLAAANKRVANILIKNKSSLTLSINESLLIEDAEKSLVSAFNNSALILRIDEKNYSSVLLELSRLKPEIDDFFNNVMVMVDDENLRNNRLAILYKLRSYFLQIADISLLASK